MFKVTDLHYTSPFLLPPTPLLHPRRRLDVLEPLGASSPPRDDLQDEMGASVTWSVISLSLMPSTLFSIRLLFSFFNAVSIQFPQWER